MPRLKPVSSNKFEKFLLKAGCNFSRQKGSHRIYRKDGLKRPIIVPQTKHLTINVILSNLRTLKMDREEYLKIISRV